MLFEMDGRNILSECDFHREIDKALNFGPYYGRNLDALFDRLSTDVERPVTLVWKHSEISREHMGDSFSAVVDVLRRVQAQDEKWGLRETFRFELQ